MQVPTHSGGFQNPMEERWHFENAVTFCVTAFAACCEQTGEKELKAGQSPAEVVFM